jgi:hypothetical protein
MCYELLYRNRTSAKDKSAHKVASVSEKVSSAKPPTESQPVTRTKEKQEKERELETTPA